MEHIETTTRSSLVESFEKSLTEETFNLSSYLLEVGTDSLMDDGFLKDIPFLSAAVSVY